MKNLLVLLFAVISFCSYSQADTMWFQTYTFDSTGRNYYFNFPDIDHNDYQKIIMQYRMRCKNALVSDGNDRNRGCGEWDYSCNTYITDTSRFDSMLIKHPSHIIQGFSKSAFSYSQAPLYDLVRKNKWITQYDSTLSEVEFPFNENHDTLLRFQTIPEKAGKVQFLFSKEELIKLFGDSKEIDGIKLNADTGAGVYRNLRIAIKNTDEEKLNPLLPTLENEGFIEVFAQDYEVKTGENHFKFHTPVGWNNTGWLVQFTFDQGSTANVTWDGVKSIENMALLGLDEGYFKFGGSGYLSLDHVDFSSLDSNITISFWSRGNKDFLGSNNSTIFEGVDSTGQRQVNVHLPWSNGRVYWDCGNDGSGFDRLERPISSDLYEGKWNHWMFTKNVSDRVMRIYNNNKTVNVSGGKPKPFHIDKMNLGTSFNESAHYWGDVSDFYVWNTAMKSDDVEAIMQGDKQTFDRFAEYLVVALKATSPGIKDVSGKEADIQKNGIVYSHSFSGNEIFKNFQSLTIRPNLIFVEGNYHISSTQSNDYDTLYTFPVQVVEYMLDSESFVPVDTNYFYKSDFTYIFSPDGEKIDSIAEGLDSTISIETLHYYRRRHTKLEIMSFVTPYGIGLDFGEEGKMWEFDVTDFGPVLRGRKRLSLERGGQNQEQMDIKFGYILGEPSREVLDVQQIWRVNSVHNRDIINNTRFESRELNLLPHAKQFKIRSVITGHGQEGEFIPRNHHITVNDTQFERTVWTECADNPIFPQGGTWIYDRAGWCPGAPSDVAEYDITNIISERGEHPVVDYGMEQTTGDSRYIVNNQLIQYGPQRITLDVAVEKILRPNNTAEFERMNPSCENPLIEIQNKGKYSIFSVDFKYKVNGGETTTYTWRHPESQLKPYEKARIELPVESDFWAKNAGVFTVEITGVNDNFKDYPHNNIATSKFDPFPVYQGNLKIDVKTNLVPQENSFTVTSWHGVEAYNVSTFPVNRLKSTIMDLSNGCYVFDFQDKMMGQSGQNGLSFWAQSQFGSGWIRLVNNSTGDVIKGFESDFGAYIKHVFMVDNYVGIDGVNQQVNLVLYPNPTDGKLFIHASNVNSERITLEVYNVLGKRVYAKQTNVGQHMHTEEIDLTRFNKGTYILKIHSENSVAVKQFILQ